MYLTNQIGEPTNPSPVPAATPDEALRKLAEQRRDELLRTCSGVTVLQRLDRFTPAARVAYWEMVLRLLPYVLKLKAELAKQVREGKLTGAKSAVIFNKVYAKVLHGGIDRTTMPIGDRVIDRIERYLESNNIRLRASGGFNQYLVASEIVSNPPTELDDDTLRRFESMFKAINALY